MGTETCARRCAVADWEEDPVALCSTELGLVMAVVIMMMVMTRIPSLITHDVRICLTLHFTLATTL